MNVLHGVCLEMMSGPLLYGSNRRVTRFLSLRPTCDPFMRSYCKIIGASFLVKFNAIFLSMMASVSR